MSRMLGGDGLGVSVAKALGGKTASRTANTITSNRFLDMALWKECIRFIMVMSFTNHANGRQVLECGVYG